jgi:Holliday junction resolvase RusA-like endonuclease
MPELCFEVVTVPVAKARARVAIRGGRAHAYTPRKTENAEWRIRTAFLERFPGHQPFAGPVELEAVAWLDLPSSMAKKRRATARPVTRPDVDNYLKTVLDALNGVAFVDDSQVVRVTCAKRYTEVLPSMWEITIREITVSPMAQPIASPGDSHGSTATQLR